MNTMNVFLHRKSSQYKIDYMEIICLFEKICNFSHEFLQLLESHLTLNLSGIMSTILRFSA